MAAERIPRQDRIARRECVPDGAVLLEGVTP